MKKIFKKPVVIGISLLLVACSVFATVSVTAGTGKYNPEGEPKFEFTYNGVSYKNEYERLLAEDGFIYGMDNGVFGTATQGYTSFGDSPVMGYQATYDEASFRGDLYNIKAFGFNAVNVWVIAEGAFGLEFDHETGIVTGIQDKLLKNMESALKCAREVGIDIVPSINIHGLMAAFYNDSFIDETEEAHERAYKYYRYYWDGEGSEARNAYMKHVKPLIELFAEYQDVIPIVDLTVENGASMVNDPETGMFYSAGTYGRMTWEDFASYVNELGGLVKEVMPNMMTSVEEMGQDWHYLQHRYNELENVDIIGRNLYSSAGKPTDNEDTYLTKPTYIGEYNIAETGSGYTTERVQEVLTKFYDNTQDSGYKGLFFFSWTNSGELSTWDTNDHTNLENLKPFVAQVSYKIKAQKSQWRNSQYGTAIPTIEKPAMLNYNGGKNVYWVGSKGVSKYELYRSFNGGKFTKITTQTQNDMGINGIFTYVDEANYKMAEDFEKQNGYFPKISYRVVAVTEDGKRFTSDNGANTEYFIPKEMIIDGSFETLGETYKGDIPVWSGQTVGWGGNENDIGIITDKEARTGKYCLYIDHSKGIGYTGGVPYASVMLQEVELEPGKRYMCSYYLKDAVGADWSVIIKANRTDGSEIGALWLDTGTASGWVKKNIQFVCPDDGKVRIYFIYNHDGNDSKNQFKAYIDDISIKEMR